MITDHVYAVNGVYTTCRTVSQRSNLTDWRHLFATCKVRNVYCKMIPPEMRMPAP